MSRFFLGILTFSTLALLAACSSGSDVQTTARYHILKPQDTIFHGRTIREWGQNFAQWYVSIPQSQHPFLDKGPVSTNQHGDVWFIGGTLDTATGHHPNLERSATLPRGTALFAALYGFEADTSEGYGIDTTARMLRNKWDNGKNDFFGTLTFDGENIANVSYYFVDTARITLIIPDSNIHGPKAHACTAPGYAIGYYMAIDDLAVGSHSLYFNGGTSTNPGTILYKFEVQ